MLLQRHKDYVYVYIYIYIYTHNSIYNYTHSYMKYTPLKASPLLENRNEKKHICRSSASCHRPFFGNGQRYAQGFAGCRCYPTGHHSMADPSFLGCDNVEAARHTAHGLGKIFVLNRIIDQRHPQQKICRPQPDAGGARRRRLFGDRQADRQTDRRTDRDTRRLRRAAGGRL